MRVISGSVGGLKLSAPKGMTTRPTTDRVKEALFSILEHAGFLEGSKVLDLFAGSGALGIEAISRGAASCIFVENNRSALQTIRVNLSRTGLEDKANIISMDVLKAIEKIAQKENRFKLALLDPPYDSGVQVNTIKYLATYLMEPDGMIVLEVSSRSVVPQSIAGYTRINRRVYGDTALEFFTLEGSDVT